MDDIRFLALAYQCTKANQENLIEYWVQKFNDECIAEHTRITHETDLGVCLDAKITHVTNLGINYTHGNKNHDHNMIAKKYVELNQHMQIMNMFRTLRDIDCAEAIGIKIGSVTSFMRTLRKHWK
tara:strand:- start:30 stop:404 length:375 start_codon:yes stop_codon:yes gene_type:complete